MCLICALSDSILIFLGVVGFSKIIHQFPLILVIAKYFGAAFLFFYGIRNFYSALKNNTALHPSDIEKTSLLKIISICLALTWLNPHVYLDTVILMGSIAVSFKEHTYWFALGAISSSWLFFFSLGYGAQLLLPIFKKKNAWQILDTLMGLMMWSISISLLI